MHRPGCPCHSVLATSADNQGAPLGSCRKPRRQTVQRCPGSVRRHALVGHAEQGSQECGR